MADFDPRQLDQLEDALELLESPDDLESLELSTELAERLGEYQDILALCRDAFPLESPGDELLDGVIAEAREVSRRGRLGHDGDRSAWRQFWDRWRGTLVPGFALAGTAAAVLWLLEPPEASDGAELARAEQPRELDRQNQDDKRSEPASEPVVDDGDDPTDELETDEASTDSYSELGKAIKQRKKAKPSEPEPEPAPAPMTKDELWSSLERANSARRAGDCDRARKLYDHAIAVSTDSLATAQAQAGIGLCLEQDRREADAESWYSQARSASPSINAWIASERDEQPRPGEAKTKKTAPKPASSAKKSKKSKKDAIDLPGASGPL